MKKHHFMTFTGDFDSVYFEATIRKLDKNPKIKYIVESKDNMYIDIVHKCTDLYLIVSIIIHYALNNNLDIIKFFIKDLLDLVDKLKINNSGFDNELKTLKEKYKNESSENY